MSNKKTYLYTLFICVSILILLHIGNFGKDDEIIRVLHNIGHLPMFSLVTFLAIYTLRHLKAKVKIIIYSSMMSSFLAIIMELIQIPIGRDADLSDLLLDLSGVIFAILLYLSYFSKYLVKILYVLMAFLLLSFSLFPYYSKIAYFIKIRNDFPIICDFEKSYLFENLSPFDCALDLYPVPSVWGQNTSKQCGKIKFDSTAQFSGFEIIEMQSNWSLKDSLMIDVFYAGMLPNRHITIRVNDKSHSGDFNDRFNKTVILNSGETKIEVPLGSIENAPTNRKMNLSEIEDLIVFTTLNDWDTDIYIDNIQLK